MIVDYEFDVFDYVDIYFLKIDRIGFDLNIFFANVDQIILYKFYNKNKIKMLIELKDQVSLNHLFI